jgi:hypothetical protein
VSFPVNSCFVLFNQTDNEFVRNNSRLSAVSVCLCHALPLCRERHAATVLQNTWNDDGKTNRNFFKTSGVRTKICRS